MQLSQDKAPSRFQDGWYLLTCSSRKAGAWKPGSKGGTAFKAWTSSSLWLLGQGPELSYYSWVLAANRLLQAGLQQFTWGISDCPSWRNLKGTRSRTACQKCWVISVLLQFITCIHCLYLWRFIRAKTWLLKVSWLSWLSPWVEEGMLHKKEKDDFYKNSTHPRDAEMNIWRYFSPALKKIS